MLRNLQFSGVLGLLVAVLFPQVVSLVQSSIKRPHVEWKFPRHHRSLSLNHLQTLLRMNDLRFGKCYQRTVKHPPKIVGPTCVSLNLPPHRAHRSVFTLTKSEERQTFGLLLWSVA